MENIEKKIREGYVEYVSTHGTQPASIAKFMEELALQEADFYRFYNSLGQLAEAVWQQVCERTIERTQAQDVYAEYMVRQKMLSFAYTLLEELKPYRKFAAFCFRRHANVLGFPEFLDRFKSAFLPFAKELIAEGTDSEEVALRPFISEQYENVLWLNVAFVIHYWSKDESKEFERTDAAVEKSVNFTFDLLGRGVFDSAFDLGRFLLQIK